ncbi:MAG: 4-hydroxythreonine-4-phosphate dehydrogenase PdxA [Hyphomicrobiales bacterium]|nr:4-hydroxythreonine-4-phosphate dehydrogenase PdxA [Hyphomicrobiales bacterium]
MNNCRPTNPVSPIAMTMGDPAGIGPEIALKSWLAREKEHISPFCYIGDLANIRETALNIAPNADIVEVASIDHSSLLFNEALPVYNIPLHKTSMPGRADVQNALATLHAIKFAVAATIAGTARAVVTNPIAKHILRAAGFQHPGHTEYLGQLARDAGYPCNPVMMIAAPSLRVVPLTIHIPLHAAPSAITQNLIISTALTVASDLRQFFGVLHPRLAITGLNPHAGENGDMGTEEQTIIAPAIEQLRLQGMRVTGPHPADTLFHERARAAYDVVIAMYHDQALIPIKTLAFDEGVNVTLGLPFIRTSPDHGTAFNIAGTGRANPSSLIHALRLAASMADAKRAAATVQ